MPAVADPSVKITKAFERLRMNQFEIATRGPSNPMLGRAAPKSTQAA